MNEGLQFFNSFAIIIFMLDMILEFYIGCACQYPRTATAAGKSLIVTTMLIVVTTHVE